MNRHFRLLVAAALAATMLSTTPAASQTAQPVSEGYASVNYGDIIQTIVVLGGYDIEDPQVAEAYVRQQFCDQFKKLRSDDFAWDALRKQAVQRLRDHKEPYRIQYEHSGVISLGRYDSAIGGFPLTPDSAMQNVGHMEIVSEKNASAQFCAAGDTGRIERPFFPLQVGLTLANPLTITHVYMPQDRAEAVLKSMAAQGLADRQIYVRIRFRVAGQPTILTQKERAYRADLSGQLRAVDFFLDKDLTIWLAAQPVGEEP